MPFRDESDMRTLMASAADMGDERGRDEYDEQMTDAEYEAAKRQHPALNRLQYNAMIDGALGKEGLCPDGYLMLSKAESFLVSQAFDQKVPWETVAKALIDLRREGQLFNILKASTQLATITAQLDRIANFCQSLPQREEHDAVLADVVRLQEQVRGLSLARVA